MIIVDISNEMYNAAVFFAKQRIVYEYPRKGYGKYDEKHHLQNLIFGYLGEFSFLSIVTEHFKIKYKGVNDRDRFDKIKKEQFVYNFIIGTVDDGFDFKIKNKEIDVKTYGTKLLKLNENISKYNLLIDERQAKNHIADIYVQTFITGDNKPEKVVLSGYYEGLPPINNRFPKPAHAIQVSQLKSIENLLEKYF